MLQEMRRYIKRAFEIKGKTENEQEATQIEDTQRLVTEIEMAKVVLYLASRK